MGHILTTAAPTAAAAAGYSCAVWGDCGLPGVHHHLCAVKVVNAKQQQQQLEVTEAAAGGVCCNSPNSNITGSSRSCVLLGSASPLCDGCSRAQVAQGQNGTAIVVLKLCVSIVGKSQSLTAGAGQRALF